MHVMQAEAIMADSELSEPMLTFNRRTVEELGAQIARGIELDEIPAATDPARSAMLILGMLRGVTLLMQIDPEGLGQASATLDVTRDIKALLGCN